MNIQKVIVNLLMSLFCLLGWPTAAHAQSTTTIRGAGLQPLVEETGSSQTLNIYGPGGVIIAQVTTESATGGTPTTQTRYLLHDHLGSTRVVLDSNNQVLGSFDYSPFGETTVSNGAAGNVADVAYRYTGQEVNGALGTYNYHARHYDAGVGRFLRVDPAHYNSSPYVYANDNPINFVDQTGQQPVIWLVARDIYLDTIGHRDLLDLLKLAKDKTNIRNVFGTLEDIGLDSPVPQSNFSLVISAHGGPEGFQILENSSAYTTLTPKELVEFVYNRLIVENLQSESLTSVYLDGCRAGCERNGVSAARRFFQHGLERFPNLERVIASPYTIAIGAEGEQAHLRFFSPIEGQPNRRIVLDTSYDPQKFFEQNIDEAVLRANISSLEYYQKAADGLWKSVGEVPHHLQARILSEHFNEPLLRTYTRSQVEQRSTLRELPFFSEAELP